MKKIIKKYGSLQSFLESAKSTFVSVEELKKELNLLKGKKSTLEENEKRLQEAKDKLISKIIKDKKKELIDAYNQKLVELDSSLRKAKKEKEKEKQKIIKEKVIRGTKKKNENILFLKNNLKSIIKEKKLNSFLNTDLYYYIFAPSNLLDCVLGVVLFVVCFVGIPFLVCFIFKEKFTLWIKIMIFVIDIFLFGVVYLILCHIGRCDNETMREIRELRKDIKENKKDVNRLTKEISKEKIDGNNEYTKIDRLIETINLEIKNLKDKHDKDINIFEKATKNIIINQVEKESKKDFTTNEKALKATNIEVEKKEEEYKKIKNIMEINFISLIGKDNMSEKTIDSLINIANKNEDITLEEALQKIKK